jgi:hypothetical protein
MDGDREVTITHEAACPRCAAGPHTVRLAAVLSRGTLLFGGENASAAATATATLTCPETGAPFEVTVRVPAAAGERVTSLRVVEADDADSPVSVRAAQSAAPEDWRAGDMADWRKAAAAPARDAAAKLLGAGTAAVGAYFAVLEYVGGDDVAGWRRVVSVFPAIGYLAVCVLAAAALRPVLMRVYGPDDFERFREERLVRLNRLLVAAVITFVTATALAAFAFVVVWS